MLDQPGINHISFLKCYLVLKVTPVSIKNPALPRSPAVLEKKFMQLRNEWKAQRGHEPSTAKIVALPAYQKIIGMGQDAIPFLLRELDTNLDNWFWALMMITDENPVSEDLRGDGEAMARAWIQWGKEHGFEW